MVRRFVALTPLRKSKAHAHAACLQRMWRRHSSRRKVRYMFAQRILDVRATRVQVRNQSAIRPSAHTTLSATGGAMQRAGACATFSPSYLHA